jgi:hypothetical protein
MKPKPQAILTAIVGAITGFVSFIANTPPEQQSALLGQLVELMPVEWRPTIALWARFISGVAVLWATYKAAQSGPKAPPPVALTLPHERAE